MRAENAVAATGDPRMTAAQVDASDSAAISRLLTEQRIDAVLGATDPRFTMPIFRAALAAGCHYLDMAMSLSRPHPEEPFSRTGVKLGDEQFALAADWERAGKLALVGIGVEPGLSDVLARYASDHLFSEIDQFGVRDGANLEVLDEAGRPMFAPTFSIWTTIEECLNPPVIYEAGRGWYTTEPFSEPEIFDFPEGIGPVECVNVEHEEVLLMPRWLDAGRVDFKYGLGEEFIGVLRTLHQLGLDSIGAAAGRRRSGQPARRGGRRAAGSGAAGRPDARQDLRRGVGARPGRRRPAPVELPLPRGGQRVVDGRVRLPGGALADRGQSGGRPGADRRRGVERGRGARPGGLRRGAIPGAAPAIRLAVGDRRALTR